MRFSPWRRVGNVVSGKHSFFREVGDLGKGAYKYVASPQKSFIYGRGPKGFSIGQGLMSTTHNLAKYGAMIKGDAEKTTYGKREAAAREGEIAAQEAVARKAAHDAEVAALSQASLGSVAARRRRGPYGTLLTGTPKLSQGSTSGSAVLGY